MCMTTEGPRENAELKWDHPVAQLLDRKWLISSSVESGPRAAIKGSVMLLQKALWYCDRARICGKCQAIVLCCFLVKPRLTGAQLRDCRRMREG